MEIQVEERSGVVVVRWRKEDLGEGSVVYMLLRIRATQ